MSAARSSQSGYGHQRYSGHKGFSPLQYVKGRFVQCNRVWVSDTSKDATSAAWDADYLVDWREVLRVDLFVPRLPVVCPVCLDCARVPKVTKCGHVFCWPCINQFFSYSEDAYRRCPVCSEQTCQADLKAVRFMVQSGVSTSGPDAWMDFALLERDRAGSVAPVPVGLPPRAEDVGDGITRVPAAESPCARFSRVVRTRSEFNQTQALEDLADLARLRETSLALQETERLPHISACCSIARSVIPSAPDGSETHVVEAPPESYETRVEPLPPPDEAADAGRTALLFYQASDGQLVFWDPFYAKVMAHDVGGWPKLPRRLRVRIAREQTVTLNADAKDRYRYLAHLPTGTEVRLVEPKLQLSQETMQTFGEALERRKAAQKRDARRQRRDEDRVDRNAAWAEEEYKNTYVTPVAFVPVPTKEDFALTLTGEVAPQEDDAPTEEEPAASSSHSFAKVLAAAKDPPASAVQGAKQPRSKVPLTAEERKQVEYERELNAQARKEARERAAYLASQVQDQGRAIDSALSEALSGRRGSANNGAEAEEDAGRGGGGKGKKKNKPTKIRLFG